MAVIPSLIDPHGESARTAAAEMRARVADVRARTLAARRPQVQERIDRLIDSDAAFLELSPLLGGGDEAGRAGAGIVTGIGWIGGVACMIVADDATAADTALDALVLRKQQRAQDIAAADRMPCIYLVDGGTAAGPSSRHDHTEGAEIAALLAGQASMSAAGIPQVVVLLGSGDAAGRARVGPGDETVALAQRGHPTVDYLARDETHALAICREIVAGLAGRPNVLPWARLPSLPPAVATPDPDDSAGSPQDPTGIYAVAGAGGRPGPDAREVLARLLDGSDLHEVDGLGDRAVTCGFGHLDGVPLGVLAVTGRPDALSSPRGVRFVAMAERRGVPILVVETGVPDDGGAGNGLGAALAHSSAPIFALLLTGGDGSARGEEQARGEGSHAGTGSWLLRPPLGTRGTWRWPRGGDAGAFDTPHGGWDDGVIDPAQTRDVLALALNAAFPAG